jgi:polo-like kinase 4
LKQIINGINYLHSHNIIHCDIKLDNILIRKDNTICLGDFGCFKKLNNNDDNLIDKEIVGTHTYLAPEIIMENNYIIIIIIIIIIIFIIFINII